MRRGLDRVAGVSSVKRPCKLSQCYRGSMIRLAAQRFTEEPITVLDVQDELQKSEAYVGKRRCVLVKVHVKGKEREGAPPEPSALCPKL